MYACFCRSPTIRSHAKSPNRSTLAGALKTRTLDAQGNWTTSGTDGTATRRVTNRKNQVTAVGANTLTFDNNGNTTTDETGRKYVYDGWNRLVTVKNAGNTVIASYKCDPNGRRIRQTEGGVTMDLFYGGEADRQLLKEQVGGVAKARNVWSKTYINDLVLRDRDADNNAATGNLGKTGSGLEERIHIQRDANHNVTAITGVTGAVLQRWVHDSYGLGQIVTEFREHNGRVNGGGSRNIRYAYSEMSGGANHSRLTGMTYPNDRVLNHSHGSRVPIVGEMIREELK